MSVVFQVVKGFVAAVFAPAVYKSAPEGEPVEWVKWSGGVAVAAGVA